MNIDSTKGAYLFSTNNYNIFLFIYMKLNKINLKKALSINYKDDINLNYICVYFDFEGRKFLEQSSLNNIKENIKINNMKNIMNHSYEELKKFFSNLTIEKYEGDKIFCKQQFNNIHIEE